MSLGSKNHSPDGWYPSSSDTNGPYEPSIASSASSSQVSVFSDPLPSSQSSVATSVSDDFRITHDDARERDRLCAQVQLREQSKVSYVRVEEVSVFGNSLRDSNNDPALSYAGVTAVPASQRQHPRRCSGFKNQKPPPLVRQRDRKISFVDNLVDSATQMVEVIWPLSVVPCRSENNGGRGVLPLRTYIEETLRRSRTSYSTLQVALYYLIMIKPSVPRGDFTMEQKMNCPASRALMCGRRMFLAALILASKYLQDRNYSAKAWSKMSGLKVCEINTNERTFLSKIDWRLHIPKPTFERWQEIVLRCTPSPPPSPGAGAIPISPAWKSIIPLLTPELDNLPLPESKPRLTAPPPENCGWSSPTTPTPTKNALSSIRMESNESTPTPATALPRFLEPKPELAPPTPALVRLGPLPTPQMTPSSVASSTPAVSACSSRRPSMSSAMALAQKTSLNRCILDTYPPSIDVHPPTSCRRPSWMSVASSGSSPESMISDNSCSSRSSSISSISTVSSMAPHRACLARQATCRNAGRPPFTTVREEKEGTATKPITIDDDVDMVASPLEADFSVSSKALHAPHRHSKHGGLHPNSIVAADKGRKRCRSRGHRRSELEEEVRYLLRESLEDDPMEIDDRTTASPSPAAYGASDMLLSRHCDSLEQMIKEPQPPASLSRRESIRLPVQKHEGKKRHCCSSTTGTTGGPYASASSSVSPPILME